MRYFLRVKQWFTVCYANSMPTVSDTGFFTSGMSTIVGHVSRSMIISILSDFYAKNRMFLL